MTNCGMLFGGESNISQFEVLTKCVAGSHGGGIYVSIADSADQINISDAPGFLADEPRRR